MAQHIKLDQDKDTLILDVAKTALRTAKSAQTRKSGSAFYPTGDGQGVLVGGMADHGIDKWDPETGEQNPLWEGISQEELDAKAEEILGAAKADTEAQIEQVNKDLEATSDRIDTKADEILEAAKADATAKADAVDQKVQATNSKVQANADAISAAQAAAEDALQNAAELLVNGGFEQGPVGWRATDGKAFVQDSQWCRSGVKRAYLNGSAGTKEIVSVNPVAVSVGRTYRFAAWYKLLTALSGNDSGGLRLMGTTAATVSDSTVWTPLPPTVDMQYTGDTWTRAVQTVVVPDGVKWIRAAIVFTSPVDAYFDDCSLIDATDVVALETAATTAQATADEAKQAALGARVTADGKNAIYRQTTDPALDPVTGGKLVAGDLWWQTSEANLETYWLGEPNNSVSVLVDHSDEIEAMWIWNGSRWNRHVLYAQDILVNGSIVAELLAVDCVEARHIKVGAIEADKLAATALYGHVIKGGTFLTSNERLVINNEGLLLKDSGGNATITMLASNGSATFRDVSIIDGSLTTPSLISSDIQGGTVSGATVTGGTVQTVTDANRGIKMTGGNFDIYRSDQTRFLRANEAGLYINDGSKDVLSFAPINGEWALTLDGAIQSGGEISGPVITAPTIQTSSAENTGLKFTTGGLVAFDANGNTTFTLDNTGGIMMAGALLSNATLTAPLLQTDPAADRGIKIVGNTLTAFSRTGTPMLSLNGDTGSAVLVGGFKTAQSGRRLEITNSVYGDVSVGAIHGYDLVGESWHIVGSSDRTSGDIDSWYTTSLGIGINPQQPEINIRYENRYEATTMRLLADRIDIIGAGDGRTPHGDGVYVNERRIDWEQSWSNLPLANGATAVGTAQYGQRAGLLVFRGRIKCTGSGDCDLFDLSAIYGGFETSTVNRTWIIGTMTNGLATTARAYIPANSTMLRVNNGPHDWVDIGSIVIGL